MATLFTRIIEGEIPGRFVWRDERAVAFLTIAPLAPGHVLVVPIEEVDHWIDLEPDLLAHVMEVARTIGRAQQEVFRPTKVGVMVVGEEVPHAHVHLVPFTGLDQLDFAHADHDPDPAALDDAAARLRDALRAAGAPGVADA
ncbi:HIT family protein [Iamia sp. SCSIO 61187]|uniref:HIT family protein n=1 Tax=Iamia sp. SCSIO 61187 TaxID=2722752 RepID=UPI001C633011|nr:HIT family protein [Iamia sp. SCSIO 61187]QYG92952.1 HIT family protein [Iamia sp. SCSIO 61187]